jgi:ABC-type glycerol-3-phosphate transport system substrate-binding protein
MNWKALMTTAAFAVLMTAAPSLADDVTGSITLLTWVSGSELATLHKVEAAFVAKHPGVSFKEIVPSFTGDPRGGLRTVLLGGEPLDLIENTWPAFRAELAGQKLIRPIDDQWTKFGWDKVLNPSWKALGQTDGTTYGVQFTYGDRSSWYYLNSTLAKAGVTPPKTWDDFLASFAKFKAVGVTPVALPAKVWAHAEWFQSLLIRVGGVEAATKLAKHQIPWTDPVVKQALGKWKDMIVAGGIAAPQTVLGLDWDNAADQVLKSGTAGYEHIGMWVAQYSADQFGIKPGTDFGLTQFPALGLGHDDTSMVDSKEFLAGTSGKNPVATDAFLDFLTSADAGNILAKDGFIVPSTNVDTSLYNPVIKAAADAVGSAKHLQFVLGDLLPGDLVDEYRVQLQKFIQSPTDATIDSVTAAIEAKAADAY